MAKFFKTYVSSKAIHTTASQPMYSSATAAIASMTNAAPRRNACWHLNVARYPWPRANTRNTSASRAVSLRALTNAIARMML